MALGDGDFATVVVLLGVGDLLGVFDGNGVFVGALVGVLVGILVGVLVGDFDGEYTT